MASNPLLSAFAIGRQSAKGTQATKLFTAMALVSGLATQFETGEQIYEHPNVTGNSRTFGKKEGSAIRTGYKVPYKATFRARANFLGAALVSMGYIPTTVSSTGYYTHTFVLAASPAVFPWCSVFESDDDAGTQWERVAKDSRSSKLSFDADPKKVQCDLTGMGLIEGIPAGSPTRTDEVADQLLPTIGSFTATLGGVALSSIVRGIKCDLENEFDQEDYLLFQTAINDLPQTNAKTSGSLVGFDFTSALYKKLNWGGTSGTAPSLALPTGPLSFNFASAANIGATAVPYSISLAMASVDFKLPEDIAANGKDLQRVDVAWEANDAAEPVTVVLVNNVASYAA